MRRRESFRASLVVATLIFFVWLILLVSGPFVVPRASLADISGSVGVRDHGAVWSSLPQPWATIYDMGDVFCHQRVDRTFVFNENELPFCQRCMGVWIGMGLGLVILLFFVFSLNGRFGWFCVLAMLPMVIDGGGQMLGFWESWMVIRFLTGLLVGVVTGVVLGVVLCEVGDVVRKRSGSGNQ